MLILRQLSTTALLAGSTGIISAKDRNDFISFGPSGPGDLPSVDALFMLISKISIHNLWTHKLNKRDE